MEKPANTTGTWFQVAVIFKFIYMKHPSYGCFFCAILCHFINKIQAFLLWHFN